eukprot:4333569-Pyramimonas_sp.AAC.1
MRSATHATSTEESASSVLCPPGAPANSQDRAASKDLRQPWLSWRSAWCSWRQATGGRGHPRGRLCRHGTT